MSTKYPSPLLGYNNNVRHKGRVFHIQTEDSGAKYGHIITHLFMDGGRILKSVKTSYAEYIGNDRMSDIVREMMKQQHKAMFIALRDGKFDPTIEGGTDASQTTQALAAESANRATEAAAEASRAASPPVTASIPAAVPPPAPVAKPSPPARSSDRPRAPAFEDEGPPTEATRELHPELMVDMQALERAAAAASNVSPVVRGAADLPPPPANLFREKGSGKYKVASPTSKRSSAPIPREEPPSPTAPADSPRGSARPDPAAERRYAPTRPAAIFGQAAPQQGKSIFGEDLISDKSLDEVILSYLAEDLEEKK